MKSNWVYYGLILLNVEKIVQHIFVTLSFYFDWGNIASTVVVSPTLLMVAGATVALLFGIALWGVLEKRAWSLDLLTALAVFDMMGEFVAQGRIDIVMTLSFLVATLLLILALVYRRQIRKGWA